MYQYAHTAYCNGSSLHDYPYQENPNADNPKQEIFILGEIINRTKYSAVPL